MPTGQRLVGEVMTPMPLVTAPVDISREDATALLRQHKRERLPLVDDQGRLAGLITVKDFVKSEQYPAASYDAEGRLLVGAAVGYFGDAYDRATTLVEAGVEYLFANFGSDHPGLIEAIAQARAAKRPCPQVITAPTEMVAMSAAHGFAQVRGRAQAAASWSAIPTVR